MIRKNAHTKFVLKDVHKKKPSLGSVTQTFNNSSTQEAGAGWSTYQGQPELHNETLSQKKMSALISLPTLTRDTLSTGEGD